jgi:hypothetical protein
LEELLPKDNEKIPLPDVGTLKPSELQAFPAEQMVRCEECLRANPPTRVNCIYCGVVLPVSEKSARLQKPALRRLEKWEHGFNCILKPATERRLSPEALAEASDLLKLASSDLQRILSAGMPLPLARAATEGEASLISDRLAELGLETFTIPDEQLNSNERMMRIRSAKLGKTGITGFQLSGSAGFEVLFNEIILLVKGRLFVKRVEVTERKSHRAEDQIVNASEFFTDATVLDIHAGNKNSSWRIEAGNFDFSLLGARKGLVAGENLNTLIDLIREHAPHMELDDSYTSVRQALEPVWPCEQRSEAIGWQRDRPGKYSTTGATESSNENQFTRYSRLRHYLKLNPLVQSQ